MTLQWYSYKFVGQTWNMDILGLYFEKRSLTLCKRVVKYAFEEPEANRYDIFLLDENLKDNIEILKNIQTKYHDPYFAKLQDKFVKLLDYLRSMEDKYYG